MPPLSDPFLYRAFAPRGNRWRRLALICLGPMIFLLPPALEMWPFHRLGPQAGLWLGLLGYTTFLCLRALMASVGRISLEKELGTWEVLQSAGMSPTRLGFGLWRSLSLPLLLELLLIAPSLCFQVSSPLPVLLLWLVLIGFYTSLGMLASLSCHSVRAAQICYGWLGGVGLLSFFAWVVEPVRSFKHCLTAFNPWYLVANQAGLTSGGSWLGLALHAGLGLIFFVLALKRVGRPAQGLGPHLMRSRVQPQQEHPLAYRGAHRLSPWSWLLYPVLILLPGVALWGKDFEAISLLSLMVHLVFWLVWAVQRSCQWLGRECEQGRLEALQTTCLGSRELGAGYWRLILQPLHWRALLLSPILLFPLQGKLAAWVLISFSTQVFLGAWGLWGGYLALRCSSSLAALQWAYLSLGLVTLGTLALDICTFQNPVTSMVSPLMAVLSLALGRASRDGWLCFCWVVALAFHAAAGWFSLRRILKRLG